MNMLIKHKQRVIAILAMIALLCTLICGCSGESSTNSGALDTPVSQETPSFEDTTSTPSPKDEQESENPPAQSNETDSSSEDNAPPQSDADPDPILSATDDSAGEDSIAEGSTFSIHFIDVGQADAALVECDGCYMLIDGGNKADSDRIYSVLKRAGASHLQILVGTHAHEDHIGGAVGGLAYATADLVLCPVTDYDSDAFQDFKRYAEKQSTGIAVPHVGDVYRLGSATVEILGVNGGEDTNDTSIVLMISYGKTRFLFTGDAEREAEQAILASGADLSATVLKVGHHGSDTSTGYVFLREIMPQYAVISVGQGNSYGHPTEEVLSRLRDADVTVYRTDLQGDVYCVSDGEEVIFTVERNSDADTLSPAGASADGPTQSTAPQENADTGESQEQGQDYVLNTNTKKFHYPSCSSVKKMADKNKSYFTGSREDVISRGYSPCGNCNP